MRAWLFTTALLVAGCADEPETANPIPCATDTDDAVWGYADLHVHPGAEKAFRETLIWGGAEDGDLPITSAELPVPTPCPVDTHSPTLDPLQRTAHSLITGLMNGQDGFVHGPIAVPAGVDAPPASAWPNARDVVHQQMHINALRRAFEGGLRLALASVTDNQALSQLLEGPRFPGPLSPSQEEEYDSAVAQLTFITRLAERHDDWMAVATSPSHAREIIRSGRLALVLSLEMDALNLDNLDDLLARFPIGHVIPVHLFDNHFGGTAVSGDIFNAGTALLSPLFELEPPEPHCPESPLAFMCVSRDASPRTRLRLARPLVLQADGFPGLIFFPDDLAFTPYEHLGYDDLDFCGMGSAADSRDGCFVRELYGHKNVRGLHGDGPAAITRLMDAGVVVDIKHMSYRSAEETIAMAEAYPGGYPIIASHNPVSFTADVMEDETVLNRRHAERLAALGGMIGLSTGRRHDEELVARWIDGPELCTVASETCVTTACLAPDGDGCAPPTPRPPPMQTGASLDVVVYGARTIPDAVEASLHTLVEVVLETDPTCADVPLRVQSELRCLGARCEASVPLPAAATSGMCAGAGELTSDAIREVAIRWMRSVDCATEELEDARFAITGAAIRLVPSDPAEAPISLFDVAPAAEPLGTLSEGRGRIDLIAEGTRCAGPLDDPRTLVRVAFTSSPNGLELPGASIGRYGAELCMQLRVEDAAGRCVAAPVDASLVEGGCRPGWRSVNHRGVWANDTTVSVFTHVPAGDTSDAVCGVNLELTSQDRDSVGLDIAEVRIESIGDPSRRWFYEYAEVLQNVFGGRPGAIAFGTDLNGGPPQLPLTAHDPAVIELSAHGCSTAPLVPMRVGDRDIRVSERGLATIGQVPDFLETLDAQAPVGVPSGGAVTNVDSQVVIDSIFRSAEEFIRVWERAQGLR